MLETLAPVNGDGHSIILLCFTWTYLHQAPHLSLVKGLSLRACRQQAVFHTRASLPPTLFDGKWCFMFNSAILTIHESPVESGGRVEWGGTVFFD